MSNPNPKAKTDYWTPERIDTLRALWDRGLSAGQIRLELGEGITRNAILGKVHRLRLLGEIQKRLLPSKPSRLSAPRPPREPRVKSTPRVRLSVARPPRVAPKPPAPAVNYTNAKPWEERRFGECAFPIGTGEDLLSCCAPTERTYCKACERVMFRPEQPTRKSTMRIARLAA